MTRHVSFASFRNERDSPRRRALPLGGRGKKLRTFSDDAAQLKEIDGVIPADVAGLQTLMRAHGLDFAYLVRLVAEQRLCEVLSRRGGASSYTDCLREPLRGTATALRGTES